MVASAAVVVSTAVVVWAAVVVCAAVATVVSASVVVCATVVVSAAVVVCAAVMVSVAVATVVSASVVVCTAVVVCTSVVVCAAVVVSAAVVVCAAVVVEAAVCGSDGRSYAGQCAVTVAACMSGRSLDVLHDGPCDELSGSGANDEHSTGRLQPTAATISSAAVSSSPARRLQIICRSYAICRNRVTATLLSQ